MYFKDRKWISKTVYCISCSMVCKIIFCSEFPNIPDKTGRKIIRRRRTQAIAKRYAFHANTIKQWKVLIFCVRYNLFYHVNAYLLLINLLSGLISTMVTLFMIHSRKTWNSPIKCCFSNNRDYKEYLLPEIVSWTRTWIVSSRKNKWDVCVCFTNTFHEHTDVYLQLNSS